MTCSSTTNSTLDRRGRRIFTVAGVLIAALAQPDMAASRAGHCIAKAREALVQTDGIAAEVSRRRALDAGAPRRAVAAFMGEA